MPGYVPGHWDQEYDRYVVDDGTLSRQPGHRPGHLCAGNGRPNGVPKPPKIRPLPSKPFVQYAVEEMKRLTTKDNYIGTKAYDRYPGFAPKPRKGQAEDRRNTVELQSSDGLWFYHVGEGRLQPTLPTETERHFFGPWFNGIPVPSKSYYFMDCFLYVRDVMVYAHEQTGNPGEAVAIDKLIKKPKSSGINLAAHLLKRGWRAYYWNRDVNREASPRIKEGKDQPYEWVRKTKIYYDLKISGFIINYLPQRAASMGGGPWQPTVTTDKEAGIFRRFQTVPFAIAIMSAGFHCFFVSHGRMFEAHNDEMGPAIWEEKDFLDSYSYHGVMLIPPTVNFSAN